MLARALDDSLLLWDSGSGFSVATYRWLVSAPRDTLGPHPQHANIPNPTIHFQEQQENTSWKMEIEAQPVMGTDSLLIK